MIATGRHAKLLEVFCGVAQVLNELPEVTRTSHEDFFETSNLWRCQVQSTCVQVREYYDSIWILAERGLLRPAAALSRSIHESSIRLEYLNYQEGSLEDWWKWQIKRAYFFFDDQLRYDELSSLNRVLRNKDKCEYEKLLGVRPTKNVAPQWKKTKELIAGAAKGMPEGYEKRWYRLLFAYPSNYVHISDASQAQEPTLAYVVGSSQSSVLMTMQVAMEICRDRRLGSCQTTQAADDIVALCQSLPGVEVPD